MKKLANKEQIASVWGKIVVQAWADPQFKKEI